MRKKIFITTLCLLVFTVFGCGSPPAESDAVTDIDFEKTYTWTYQSVWPAGSIPQEYAEMLANDVNAASGGRLVLEILPAGAVVDAFDVLEAVSAGTIDASHTWLGYWMGQMEPAGLFASMPIGLTEEEYMVWMLEDEGEDLLQEMFGDYNIKTISAGAVTSEIFYHSKVPIRNLDDLIGLKVRGVGIWGDIQNPPWSYRCPFSRGRSLRCI